MQVWILTLYSSPASHFLILNILSVRERIVNVIPQPLELGISAEIAVDYAVAMEVLSTPKQLLLLAGFVVIVGLHQRRAR